MLLVVDTYTIGNWVLNRDRIPIVEAPDEIRATFLKQELQNSISVKEMAEVRLIPVGLI